jgi:glycosyltransferase involved in cell wall biosynthesis
MTTELSTAQNPRPAATGSDSSQIELTILMPCLNEAQTLETCIGKAQSFLSRAQVTGEIVVADNGSTDGSQEIARRAGARVVNVPIRGYGAALYYGSKAAHGKYIVMGDSDDSYDFLNLEPFLEKLREGNDLVMGNRFRGGIAPGAMPWKNRFIGNPVLTGIGRLLFRCPAKDFHCGLRGYAREAFDRMDLRTTGMEFASEMVIKATLMKMKITEVPTTLSPDGRSRPPHLRPWRDGWRHLRFMLLYSPRWLFLYPGILLIVLAVALAVWLIPASRVIGGYGFDVHTLVYTAAFAVIGFQAVFFSVMARMFAMNEGLLPTSRQLTWASRLFSLETGLVVGAILLAAGLFGSIYAVISWARQDFGALDPITMLRLVIPSCAGLILGSQIILGSFFGSVLGLKTRRMPR